MYEFFRPDWLADSRRLLDLLDQREVKVVVVNRFPNFPSDAPGTGRRDR